MCTCRYEIEALMKKITYVPNKITVTVVCYTWRKIFEGFPKEGQIR